MEVEKTQKINVDNLEKQALTLIAEARIPVTVDFIAHNLKVSWDTARSILLGLAIQERLKATKTMKSWIFEAIEENKAERSLTISPTLPRKEEKNHEQQGS
jgi:hypothetical protein